MLTCWQLDPDERPGPGDIGDQLRDMCHLASQHCSFVFPAAGNFSYEPYHQQMELVVSVEPSSTNSEGSYV